MLNLKIPLVQFDRDIFTMQLIFFAIFGVTSVKQEPVSLRRVAEKEFCILPSSY